MASVKNILIYFQESFSQNAGGVERISIVLGSYLQHKGYKVFYLSDNCRKSDEEYNNIFFPQEGGLSNTSNLLFLRKFIEDEDVEIIINQSGIFPTSQNLTEVKGKCKLISVMHNTLHGMYSYPNFGIKNGLTNKILYCSLLRSIYRKLFFYKYHNYFKKITEESDAVCVISEAFRKEIEEYSGNKCKNIVVIPNFLTFKRNTEIHTKENLVLFVGRLEWQKRPDLLLEIWKHVWPSFPEWNLYIAGDGSLKESLNCKILQEGIKNVKMLGVVDPIDYYKKAKILCMTSCYESFGLVLLEAMNFNTLPIAFDSFPNLRDIIYDKQDGLIIKFQDIDNYVRQMKNVMEDDNFENYYLPFKQKIDQFSVDEIGKKWEELFSNLYKDKRQYEIK